MTLYAKIDCASVRDPKMIAAGPHGRLIYWQAVLYCRENLTDGYIDALLLPLVAVDIPNPKKHMARLVDLGALDADGDGWRIPEHVWRRWNPLKSEVDDKRAAEASRKAAHRESRRDNP